MEANKISASKIYLLNCGIWSAQIDWALNTSTITNDNKVNVIKN